MTREEYLAQLRALLTGRTPPDELERILAYYTEYFDEAGPQGEGRVIRELGTPAELVGRVLGAQRSRTVPAERDCPPEGAARERHGLGTLWKVLLAICAAPIVLAKAGLVKDKNVTAYPAQDVYRELNEAGAHIVKDENVVLDGNMLTANGPGAAMLFGYCIGEYLGEDLQVAQLKEQMCYTGL